MAYETYCGSSRRCIASATQVAHGRDALAILASLVLAASAQSARAMTLCADDAAGFEFALAVAGDNGQDDEIRLQRGTYETTDALRFGYLSGPGESFDIEISGDWNAGCTVQGNSTSTTVIDGSGIDHALVVWSAGDIVTVRQLTFVGGVTSAGNQTGGGLQIVSLGNDDALVYTIEKNQFVGNQGEFGGGLDASGATIIQAINNVFVANSVTVHAAAAALIATDSGAVYFANNTVVANGDGSSALWIDAPLGAYVVNNNFWANAGLDLLVVFDPAANPTDVLRNNNIANWSIANFPILENNIHIEPEYQSGFLNFTPVRNSPLVDAGTEPEFLAFWYLTDTDNNGAPRVVGPHVDIGAFENETIFTDGFDPASPFGDLQ